MPGCLVGLRRSAPTYGKHSRRCAIQIHVLYFYSTFYSQSPPVTRISTNICIFQLLRLSVFTARRVCIARTMPWQDVCLSVCLSHAGILSKRLYVSSKFFSPSGSPTILVFPHQTGWQYSDRNPLTRACKGYEKIAIFDHYLALTRK